MELFNRVVGMKNIVQRISLPVLTYLPSEFGWLDCINLWWLANASISSWVALVIVMNLVINPSLWVHTPQISRRKLTKNICIPLENVADLIYFMQSPRNISHQDWGQPMNALRQLCELWNMTNNILCFVLILFYYSTNVTRIY
jgi:hypothetical protein